MKPILLYLWIISVTIFAYSAESRKPRIDGHADGETQLPVSFLIVDAQTNEPVANVQVKFFNESEVALLNLIEFEKKRRGSTQNIEPKGIVSKTNKKGYATLKCLFDAAFLWSYESGSKKDVGTDVFPSGRFIVSKDGYITIDRQAREVFSDGGYSRDGFSKPTKLLIARVPLGD